MFENVDPDRLKLTGLLLGASGASLLANWALRRRLDSLVKSVPRMPPGRMRSVYRSAGLDPKFPTFKYPRLENAAYATGSSGLVEELGALDDYKKRLKREPGLPDRIMRHGAVVYDPAYLRDSVLAHEAGHATLDDPKRPWYDLSRFNQRWLRPASAFASLLSPAASVALSSQIPNPALAGLAGAGVGAISSLPILANEYQATSSANRYLDQAKHLDDKQRQKHKQLLRNAYMTYLTSATLVPALAGAAGSWYFNRKQASLGAGMGKVVGMLTKEGS